MEPIELEIWHTHIGRYERTLAISLQFMRSDFVGWGRVTRDYIKMPLHIQFAEYGTD